MPVMPWRGTTGRGATPAGIRGKCVGMIREAAIRKGMRRTALSGGGQGAIVEAHGAPVNPTEVGTPSMDGGRVQVLQMAYRRPCALLLDDGWHPTGSSAFAGPCLRNRQPEVREKRHTARGAAMAVTVIAAAVPVMPVIPLGELFFHRGAHRISTHVGGRHARAFHSIPRTKQKARHKPGFPLSILPHLQLKLLALSTSPVPL